MKNILLIRPNSTNDKKDPYVTFPIGLGYIAAVLRENEYRVSIMDLTLENVKYSQLKERILEKKPDLIGITAIGHSYKSVKDLSKYLRHFLKCPIVLGGHLATYSYKMILEKTDVDICVLGEGELTIIDLVEKLYSYDWNSIKGIAYRDIFANKGVIVTEPRELIQNLDTIPFPAYDLFEMDKYTELTDVYLKSKSPSKNKIHRIMTLEAGRGCPFDCNFCSRVFRRVRKRSVDNIIKEIVYLQKIFKVDTFGFQDELLFSDKDYIDEFCKKIKYLDIGWYGNARINTIDKETMLKVKNNKCIQVAIGVESGSPTILKNMNKKIKRENIIDILSYAIKIDLPFDMGLILGYPGENEQTIKETLDMFKKIGYPALKFRYITPYPGSRLYDECINNGTVSDEEKYLISLGDGTGPYRFRINFTKFSDENLTLLIKEVTDKSFNNYLFYLVRHPIRLLKAIFKKDISNPFFVWYNRFARPTNYDKARKTK